MKLIDFHMHLFPDQLAPRAIASLAHTTKTSCKAHPILSRFPELTEDIPYTAGTLADTLRLMDEQQVDAGVMLSIATNPKQQHNVNNFAAQVQNSCPGKIYAFGSVYPTADDALDELQRIKDLGLRGVKLHPEYQDFFLDDHKVWHIFEACEALKLPITLHMGYDVYSPDLIHATPKMAAKVHKQFPDLTMILAHMGGVFCYEEAEEYLAGEDIYLDTAYSFGAMKPEQFLRLVKKHGADRILFASDVPWQCAKLSLRLIEFLGEKITPEEKEKICHLNGEKLLGL